MATKGSNKPLAAIYGQALFEAARDAAVQERVAGELSDLKRIVHQDARTAIFLETPTIAFEEKRKVIEKSFEKYTPVTRNLLLVLAQRSRAGMLDQIIDAYVDYANLTAHIATVEVHTARELENDEREKLKQLMQSKLNMTVRLIEHTDPELMGGMILIHDDKMWDGSLRRKLNDAVKTMELKINLVKWTE